MKNYFYLLRHTIMTAAFGLIVSALSAQTASVPISALPFSITAPGSYVVTGNLVCPVAGLAASAISISTSVSGNVLLDLNGYTISASPTIGSLVSGVVVLSNPPQSSVAITNGTIEDFWIGVNVNPAETASTYLSNIHIEHITFSGDRYAGVSFNGVNSSTVSDCAFLTSSGALFGIKDAGTLTGNQYTDNSFDGGQQTTLQVFAINGPLVLEHCQFKVPRK